MREAPHFGLPAINLGTRQNNRVIHDSVINAPIEPTPIRDAIAAALGLARKPVALFGTGNSAELFHAILQDEKFWQQPTQKFFVDRAPA